MHLLLLLLVQSLLTVFVFGVGTDRGSLYSLLGLDNYASRDQIRKAWRLKAVDLHPDMVEGSSGDDYMQRKGRYLRVREAYETLEDPHLKQQYEAFGSHIHLAVNTPVESFSTARVNALLERNEVYLGPRLHVWDTNEYRANFAKSRESWAVLFFASTDRSSLKLMATWKRVANATNTYTNIAVVDCDNSGSQSLCKGASATLLPSLMVFPSGSSNAFANADVYEGALALIQPPQTTQIPNSPHGRQVSDTSTKIWVIIIVY